MDDAEEPLVQVDEECPAAAPSTGKSVDTCDTGQLSVDDPIKPKKCCRYRCQRRDVCFACLGFFLALVLCGGGLFIFIKISNDNASASSLAPLTQPKITAVTADHPGWLTLSWGGSNGSQWFVKRTKANSSEEVIESVLGNQHKTDSDLTATTHYCFQVKAVTVAQNSSWSDPKCSRTLPVASPGVSEAPVLLQAPVEGHPTLTVKVLPPKQVNGSDDYGGDLNLEFVCQVIRCSNFDSSSCEPIFEVTADANQSCVIDKANTSASITIWSHSSNAGGSSNVSLPLLCVNSDSMLPTTVPTPMGGWECSRSATPDPPQLNPPRTTDSSYTVSWAASSTGSASVIDSYEVQADDWWHNKVGEYNTVETVSGQTLTATIGGNSILPGTTYNVRVGARDVSGKVGFSTSTAATTLNKGACGNPSDLTSQRDHFGTMKDTIQSALKSCILDRDRKGCATGKIAAAMGWSSACAGCWADEGLCVLKKCYMCYLKPKSQECDDCAKDQCFAPLEQCSGLPEWSFPA